jgi:hypothetical protein
VHIFFQWFVSVLFVGFLLLVLSYFYNRVGCQPFVENSEGNCEVLKERRLGSDVTLEKKKTFVAHVVS